MSARLIAPLRDGSWLTPARLRVYPALVLAGWMILVGGWIVGSHGLIDRSGHVLGTDFLNVWAASAMTLDGQAAGIYDWARHAAFERLVVGADHPFYYGWHYPPLFLLVVWPLALLPYAGALAVYLGATFPAYWTVLRRIFADRRAAVAILAFPGLWTNLLHGQNGFLTVGLLGGGLLLLERRPWLAGALLGLLAYKPQFGLLLPLALVAGGHWRAVVAAAASVVAAAGLSAAIFGLDAWRAFLASLGPTRTIIIEEGATGFAKIQSVFAAVRLLGGGATLAWSLQAAALLAVAALIVVLWRGTAPMAVKAAALVAAIPLSTPYVLDYDLVMLALPIAWLAAEGDRTGFRPWEKTLLAALWVLPMIARQVGDHVALPLTPVALAAALALLIRRAAIPAAPG